MSSPLPSMLFSKDEIRVERIAFKFCKIFKVKPILVISGKLW